MAFATPFAGTPPKGMQHDPHGWQVLREAEDHDWAREMAFDYFCAAIEGSIARRLCLLSADAAAYRELEYKTAEFVRASVAEWPAQLNVPFVPSLCVSALKMECQKQCPEWYGKFVEDDSVTGPKRGVNPFSEFLTRHIGCPPPPPPPVVAEDAETLNTSTYVVPGDLRCWPRRAYQGQFPMMDVLSDDQLAVCAAASDAAIGWYVRNCVLGGSVTQVSRVVVALRRTAGRGDIGFVTDTQTGGLCPCAPKRFLREFVIGKLCATSPILGLLSQNQLQALFVRPLMLLCELVLQSRLVRAPGAPPTTTLTTASDRPERTVRWENVESKVPSMVPDTSMKAEELVALLRVAGYAF